MTGFLEAWRPSPELVPLSGDKVTVGKDVSNDVVIESDTTVSRLHAVLERFSSGWCLRDLGSRNGTFVNGERIFGERVLRPVRDPGRQDEARLPHRCRGPRFDRDGGSDACAVAHRAGTRCPARRCAGHCSRGSLFTEAASVRDIAVELVVTEAAVRQHLLRLYAKFDVPEGGERRRVQLANEAITRGAVTVADLRAAPE